MVAGWDPSPSDQPLPPQNGSVFSAFMPGVLDLRWDDPSILGGNAGFTVVGVNIYRSDVSDRGPYYRINEFPVGGTFWRDQTENILVKQVIDWTTSWAIKGDGANTTAWMFRTTHPIVKQVGVGPFETPTAADSPRDVQLYIDDVEVPIHSVFGPAGEVTLINIPTINAVTEKIDDAVLPTASSTVEVFYYANRNKVLSGLDANVHYRLTTVVIDTTKPSGYRETELAWCEPMSSLTVERLDYIWKEAIRRNNWILQQGGERVKIFIRRRAGVPCTCKMDPETLEYQGQPSNFCEICYGTGFVGGYEGPFDNLVAPDDAERRISQSQMGRRKEHTYEVWTGPSPVVTQRDFIVKQTNERYSIGPVRRPTNRGNLLQQHFQIGYLDEQDIRYKVAIPSYESLVFPQTRWAFREAPHIAVDGTGYRQPSTMPTEAPYPEGAEGRWPEQTEKAGEPDATEQRGRSGPWANIEY